MHKLNAWAEGSWDTNGDHLFFTKPKANWTQKGPHSGIKNMDREKAYARLYKRVHVSPHLSAEMQYWPEQREPPRSLWKCFFLQPDTTFSFLSLAKTGKITEKRETEWCRVCFSLRGPGNRTLQTLDWPSLSRDLEHGAIDNQCKSTCS